MKRFLFLTEKLPRVEEEAGGGVEQPIVLARRKIGQAIRQRLDGNKVFGVFGGNSEIRTSPGI